MTLEEAMELDVDDELVKAVERVLGDLFWHGGKMVTKPPTLRQHSASLQD
jgi:hypothetical protein